MAGYLLFLSVEGVGLWGRSVAVPGGVLAVGVSAVVILSLAVSAAVYWSRVWRGRLERLSGIIDRLIMERDAALRRAGVAEHAKRLAAECESIVAAAAEADESKERWLARAKGWLKELRGTRRDVRRLERAVGEAAGKAAAERERAGNLERELWSVRRLLAAAVRARGAMERGWATEQEVRRVLAARLRVLEDREAGVRAQLDEVAERLAVVRRIASRDGLLRDVEDWAARLRELWSVVSGGGASE